MTNINLSMLKDACSNVKSELMVLLNKALQRIEDLGKDNKMLRQEIGKFKEENKKQIEENVEFKLKIFKNYLNKDLTNPISNVNKWTTASAKVIKKTVEQLIVVSAALIEANDRE